MSTGGQGEDGPDHYGCLESLAVWNALCVDSYWYEHLFLDEEERQVADKVWKNEESWVKSLGKALMFPIKLYIRYPLRKTVYLLTECPCARFVLFSFLQLVFVIAIVLTIEGFTSLLPSDQARTMGTLHYIESAWVTPFILLVVTHLVFSSYAAAQKRSFESGAHPPSPALFVFFVGKVFMLARMSVAYSASDLGATLNFFVYEEGTLIFCHVVLTAALLGSTHVDLTLPAQVQVTWRVVLVDAIKTVAVLIAYRFYSPGWLSQVFERLPTMRARISFFLLVHASLDALQSAVTLFTMYIARHVRSCIVSNKKHGATSGSAEAEGESQPILGMQSSAGVSNTSLAANNTSFEQQQSAGNSPAREQQQQQAAAELQRPQQQQQAPLAQNKPRAQWKPSHGSFNRATHVSKSAFGEASELPKPRYSGRGADMRTSSKVTLPPAATAAASPAPATADPEVGAAVQPETVKRNVEEEARRHIEDLQAEFGGRQLACNRDIVTLLISASLATVFLGWLLPRL